MPDGLRDRFLGEVTNVNVLIDALCITRRKAGVGVYAKNLVEELARAANGIRLILLIQSDDPEMDYSGTGRVKVLRMPAWLLRNPVARLIFEQTVLPILLRLYRIDVLHSLHYSFPLWHGQTRQVVTLHDMTSFRMPEVHLPVKVLYFQAFIWAASRWADQLVFVSQAAHEDFCARFPKARAARTVIHLGRSDRFCPQLGGAVERVRAKCCLPEKYFLYVGTLEPRKNLRRLTAAFARIVEERPGYSLVIAGMKGWMCEELFEDIRLLGIRDRVVFTGFVPEEDKPALLAGAAAFVYPSLSEGFGIPVLEALACAVPTVTSNVSSLPEVAGDAAVLVDPRSVTAIARAMLCVTGDPELRKQMQERALKQAQRFSWRRTAAETCEVYRQTGAVRPQPELALRAAAGQSVD